MPARFDPRRPVDGARVGQATNAEGTSGVTAIVFDQATPTVVDHRGGASATFDLGSLGLDATFGRRWAIFLSGGSVFGLDAAAGVRARVQEAGGGHSVFGHPLKVVAVSGAALFDLPARPESVPDYRGLGYEAAARARSSVVAEGRVGAGAGATVGKYLGRARAMPGGVGWVRARLGPGSVGVLVAVNAAGAVRDPATGRWVAGARDRQGRLQPPAPSAGSRAGEGHTTLSVLLTDLALERAALQRAVSIAHAGLGGAIVPFHSSVDGDVMFGAATGTRGPVPEARPGDAADRVGALAAVCAVQAAVRAVRAANGGRFPIRGRSAARGSRAGRG